MATINSNVIDAILDKYSQRSVVGKDISQIKGASISSFVPVSANEIPHITRRDGIKAYNDALKRRDAVEKAVMDQLLKIAQVNTAKIRTRNYANTSGRLASLLKIKRSYLEETGIGRSDTYYRRVGESGRMAMQGYVTNNYKSTRVGGSHGGSAGYWQYKNSDNGKIVQQRRTTYGFSFNVNYPTKELWRLSLRKTLTDSYRHVYLPYLVNNTWSRHPKARFLRSVKWEKTKKGNNKRIRSIIKTMTGLSLPSIHYMQKIQRQLQRWVDQKYPEWRIVVELNEERYR